MSDSEGCPGLERLALFVDGGLAGAERARVAAHVEGCERCYEVVVATAAVLDAGVGNVAGSDEAGRATHPSGGADVVPLKTRTGRPGGGSLMPALAAAAAIVVVAVSLFVWQSGGPDVLVRESGSLVENLAGERLGAGWDRHGWATFRGGTVRDVDDAQAFRLGVLMVDLEVARRTGGDPEPALAAIERTLSSTPLGAGVVESLRAGATVEAEQALGEWLGGWFGAGRASEAARLLAASGQGDSARTLIREVARAVAELPGGPDYAAELAALLEAPADDALAAQIATLVNSRGDGPFSTR